MANAYRDRIENDLHDLSRGIDIGTRRLEADTAIHITATVLESVKAHLRENYPVLTGVIEAIDKTIDNLPEEDDLNKDDEPVRLDPEDG